MKLTKSGDLSQAAADSRTLSESKSTVRAQNTGIGSGIAASSRPLSGSAGDYDGYRVYESIDSFIQPLERLSSIISAYLEDHDQGPMRDEILQFYFDISRFLTIYDLIDDHYVIYGETDDEGSFVLRLSCVDPSRNLSRCMAKGLSTILFSATLLPVQYYKKLLGGTPEDFEIYARSVFDPSRLGIFIGSDVTSRYSRRSDTMYRKIAMYIDSVIRAKRGNYIVFFPSHQFLDEVRTTYEDEFLDTDDTELLIQSSFMTEEARESFLDRFSAGNDIDLSGLIHMDIEITEDKSVLGFCVMGGIFSEGIDLKNDSLIGVIIVGTGIPMVCNEREILRNYFDEKGVDGFDYAYRYPGMNKVLQAAGRVIRTESDLGVALLLDDRFLGYGYKSLFPREWKGYKTVTTNSVKNDITRFYSGFQG
ncbi:MAG: ATP-dependent DNA helicase [Butyrivibrio sp.]|nr:ATP-dependent DNA helicase [Butyrivibrio sp.]